jgi:hypothetical protein
MNSFVSCILCQIFLRWSIKADEMDHTWSRNEGVIGVAQVLPQNLNVGNPSGQSREDGRNIQK